ncbi:E3 ubiquitin/ISG15 ligase TRIM25-like, partial [Clarias magur]
LLQMQTKYKEIIQDRENELQKLKTASESYKEYIQTIIQEGDRIFTEFIKSIERKHDELTWLIRSQAEAAVSRADEIIKKMKQEIAELRRKDTQMQELLHSKNNLHFLQSFQSVSAAHGFADFRTINYGSSLAFGNVLKTLSELRDQLETYINNEFKKISNQDVLFSFAPDSPSSFTFADLVKSSGGISFIKK